MLVKPKIFIKLWIILVLLAIAIVSCKPSLLTGSVDFAWSDHTYKINLPLAAGYWLISYLLIQLVGWIAEYLAKIPENVIDWYNERQHLAAKNALYQQIMNILWLTQGEKMTLPATQVFALNDPIWLTIRQTLAVRQATLLGDYRLAFTLIPALSQQDAWWGKLWYWKVRALSSMAQTPSSFGDNNLDNTANESQFDFKKTDVSRLNEPLLLELATHFEASGYLEGLDLLLKKGDWHALNEQYKSWEVRRWRIYLALHESPSTSYKEWAAHWKQVPGALRDDPSLAAWWIEKLLSLNAISEAKSAIIKALERHLSATLLPYYTQIALSGAVSHDELMPWLERIEKWLDRFNSNDHKNGNGSDDAHLLHYELLAATGQICTAMQMWGKAADYWQQAKQIAHKHLAHLSRYLTASQQMLKLLERSQGTEKAYSVSLEIIDQIQHQLNDKNDERYA